MASALLVFLTISLCAAPAFGQLGNLLLRSLFGGEDFEMDDDLGAGGLGQLLSGGIGTGASAGTGVSSSVTDQLNRRILALERNIETGAQGGCESGVIGPFTNAQNVGQIRFRGRFRTAPAISLAVSDLSVNNASTPLNFRIRPAGLTNAGAQVTLTETGNNLASLYVSYMACPSNSNIPIRA